LGLLLLLVLAAWSINNQPKDVPVMCGCGGSRWKDDCNQEVRSVRSKSYGLCTTRGRNQPRVVSG
jgi:hypothetical protein